MTKKHKTMAYLPTDLTQDEQVLLNGHKVQFSGSNNLNKGIISDNYFDWYLEDETLQKVTEIFQDNVQIKLETSNYSGQKGTILVSELDVTVQAFDTNISANPVSQVITHSNGDILLNSQRINVNGQLGLNGEYQVGDKTFTITNGLITNIQ